MANMLCNRPRLVFLVPGGNLLFYIIGLLMTVLSPAGSSVPVSLMWPLPLHIMFKYYSLMKIRDHED